MPNRERKTRSTSRRQFLKATGAGVGALAGVPGAAKAFDFASFFQAHFRELSSEEIDGMIRRLEEKYSEKYGKPVTVDAVGPNDGVVFGYGLDLSRCIGCRRCVYACVDENNQSRDPQIHWIRVLEFDRQDVIWESSSRTEIPSTTTKRFPLRARSIYRSPVSSARIRSA